MLLKLSITYITKIWSQNFNPILRFMNLQVEMIGKLLCNFELCLFEQLGVNAKFISN
jgi:hypothetical protein